jgi:hypothetical protein
MNGAMSHIGTKLPMRHVGSSVANGGKATAGGLPL